MGSITNLMIEEHSKVKEIVNNIKHGLDNGIKPDFGVLKFLE